MEILRELSVLWCMIHVIFLFVMLFRSRYTKKKTILLAVIGMGILMALNMAGLVLFGFDVMGNVFLFSCSIPSFVFFYVLSTDKRFRFLMTFCLADTTCLWIMAVTNLLDYYLGGGQYVLMFVSRLFAFPLIEYCVYRFLRKPYLELQDAVEKGWGVFAGMTMLYYILLTVINNYPTNIVNRPQDTPACVLVLILMLFNYATIFSALYRQLLLFRRQQSERILQEQKNYLEAQLDNQQRIRKLKHDMKAHTVTLFGLLAAGKSEEAQEYLKGMEGSMEPVFGEVCVNPYINAVLSQYAQKFQELDTKLKLDIRIGEEELPYMELCQILSNGLDNAFYALKELKKEDRGVSVQMKYSKDYLVIRVKNRCRQDMHVEKGKLPATDKKGREHGFGLPTVQESAKKLGGDMLCYTENGDFVLDVMVRVKCLCLTRANS